jgi:hypothetical protein
MKGFEAIDLPNLYGYQATRPDGITVEVVRCYENEWNVFLTDGGRVVARSVEEYRRCRDGYVPRKEAFAIARDLLEGSCA